MRKRLAVLLATIMLLALIAAGPAAAVNGEPLVTVCVLEPATEFALDVGTQEVDPITAQILINSELATLGPCPEGGGSGGGGGQQGRGGGAAAPFELNQETEQDAESGDVDQSFEVSSTGDNSNQCAGVQGVSNTGNSQNVTDLLQALAETDDFEFEEVDSDITVSPESLTTCDQQVNQAASASG
jgi:hypothetical protein